MKQRISKAGYPKYSKVNIFLNLANIIYDQYEKDKEKENKIDFNDYLINAINEINHESGDCNLRSGVNIKEIEWLLIDEFQDFSPLFLSLVKAIQKYNPEIKLFCVGDDWQAINSFAGSDVEYFEKFEKVFTKNSDIKNLTINWRSNQGIVSLGNGIMADYGVKSSANSENQESGIIKYFNVNKDYFDIGSAKVEFGTNTQVDVVFLRYLNCATSIIDQYFEDLANSNRFKLFILSRKLKIGNYKLDDFAEKIEYFFIKKYSKDKEKVEKIFNMKTDNEGNEYKQIEAKTAHQSKGLEANVVIVLDTTNRCFPLIHPDSLFFEIFGDKRDKIVDEERRLFYVACTRAKSDLYLLYEEDYCKKKILTEFCPYK